MNKQELIKRIKYIRKRAKLTQKELSMKLGLNQAYINRLETKKDFAPSFEVLMHLIEVCGSTPEEFFYHDIQEYNDIFEKLKNCYSVQISAEPKDIIQAFNQEIEELNAHILVSRLNGAFGEGFAKLPTEENKKK